MLTSGANLLKSQQPNLYQDLVKDNSFQCWDEIIMNDLNRTYPDNIYFIPAPDGKLQSLNNILRASARHNTSVGYCQVKPLGNSPSFNSFVKYSEFIELILEDH